MRREATRARATSDERLRGLDLILTSACNLHCSYCYQDARRPRRMSRATVERALDLLERSGPLHPSIVFYGGEPLLAFDLLRWTVGLAQERWPRSRRPSFHVTTNGLLLDPRKARFLGDHDVETQVSFDGSRDAQEIRAPGTFAAIARRLARLRRQCGDYYERLLKAAVTVTPAAVPSLAESIQWLVDRGVEKITVAPALVRGAEWTAAREEELDRQLGRIYRRSLRLYERTGKVPVTLFRRGPGRPVPSEASAMCRVGSCDVVTVDVDGTVYGCPMLAHSYQAFSTPGLRRWVAPLGIGSVGADDLEDRIRAFRDRLRRSSLFSQRQRKHAAWGRCAGCRHRAVCSVCPVEIARDGDDPHRVPDFLCAFSRVSLSYRERFPPQLTVAGRGGATEAGPRAGRSGRGTRRRPRATPGRG